MMLLQILILVMVGLGGAGVVLTRDPLSQAIAVSYYGILLTLMFFIFHAPDVALAQLAVSAVALPLMMLLSLAKIRRTEDERKN